MIARAALSLACSLLPFSFCQSPAQPADAVEWFRPGSGQTLGQEPEYFPANVLGWPDRTARPDMASVDPREIMSLGLGGEIVLRFDSAPIIDAEGPDFTVFENAFHYSLGQESRVYAEPAEISVSRDGITFLSFPFDTLTLRGCAGVTPTAGDRNPLDPSVSGGDSFDLATLGIDSVRYVKIRDITAMVKGNPAHPYWDPTLTGFDLDAVIAIPPQGRTVSIVEEREGGIRSRSDMVPTIR